MSLNMSAVRGADGRIRRKNTLTTIIAAVCRILGVCQIRQTFSHQFFTPTDQKQHNPEITCIGLARRNTQMSNVNQSIGYRHRCNVLILLILSEF